jgi:hypothetical protein
MPAGTMDPIPWFRRGQIRRVHALRGPTRGATPSAVVVYDDAGNLHLRVIYDRPLGRVPPPNRVRPGTPGFADAMEPLILARLAAVTGQQFRPRGRAGPELEVVLDPAVEQWVRRAQRQRKLWENQGPHVRKQMKANRAHWLNTHAGKILESIGRLTVPEMDVAIGNLTPLEKIVGREPPDLRRFRAAVKTRLGIP